MFARAIDWFKTGVGTFNPILYRKKQELQPIAVSYST